MRTKWQPTVDINPQVYLRTKQIRAFTHSHAHSHPLLHPLGLDIPSLQGAHCWSCKAGQKVVFVLAILLLTVTSSVYYHPKSLIMHQHLSPHNPMIFRILPPLPRSFLQPGSSSSSFGDHFFLNLNSQCAEAQYMISCLTGSSASYCCQLEDSQHVTFVQSKFYTHTPNYLPC